ncbi:MAG: PRTRC system protein C [Syntrophorhabdaceae bacterium]|nr:PRTRC system protein C [Syntrophorhabdaceae bacterium]
MSDLKVSTLKRIFVYNAMQLDDPDTNMKPEEVKEFWSDVYPELTQAVIEGPEYKDDCIQYTFRKAVGTKGQGKKGVSKKKTDDVADRLRIMKALARIVARTEPGARAVLPPSSSLEPV